MRGNHLLFGNIFEIIYICKKNNYMVRENCNLEFFLFFIPFVFSHNYLRFFFYSVEEYFILL